MIDIRYLPKITIVSENSTIELGGSEFVLDTLSIVNEIRKQLPFEKNIGIIFPISSRLIQTWLAVLLCGKVPCVLQIPTNKLSKDYWKDSIRHTLKSCCIDAVINHSDYNVYGLNEYVKTIDITPPDSTITDVNFGENFTILDGEVIQLSSGTTGYKKGIKLSLENILTHCLNYNKSLNLTSDDCIVSWLPLYHDMGFIACFVMPILLNIELVLIETMHWIKSPNILYNTIEKYNGTVCFLPNFGFEVMASAYTGSDIDNVRLWISCSEPTYNKTIKKFCSVTGAKTSNISVCYGMAENVFAVAQSTGINTVSIGGVDHVSCGLPITGTMIKLVDGELFVKSDTSIKCYINSSNIADSDGYYATGDTGQIINGEVFVTGRIRDIMISAGRKYLLNDLDFLVNQAIPESAGRAAVLAENNETLGTQVPIVLVERQKFWELNAEIISCSKKLADSFGIESVKLNFVPKQFITKTSSGKINRIKTLGDWNKHIDWQKTQNDSYSNNQNIKNELKYNFPYLKESTPVSNELDSLGIAVFRLIIEKHDLVFNPLWSVNDYLQQAIARNTNTDGKIFSIVSFADANWLKKYLNSEMIYEISKELGINIHFEHICVPPSSLLLSDIIYYDYFIQRNRNLNLILPFVDCIRKIKNASMILVDDYYDFYWPNHNSEYPRLSHNLTNDPLTDLLSVRWAQYTSSHQYIPKEIVSGADTLEASKNNSLSNLQAYLNKPIMKIALFEEYKENTQDWDLVFYNSTSIMSGYNFSLDAGILKYKIKQFIRNNQLEPVIGFNEPRLSLHDQPHFCSWIINKEAIDYILNSYNSFCICGLRSSIPYLENQLKLLGKTYFYTSSLNIPHEGYECVIQTGSWGMPTTNKPIFDVMTADIDRQCPINVDNNIRINCPPFRT